MKSEIGLSNTAGCLRAHTQIVSFLFNDEVGVRGDVGVMHSTKKTTSHLDAMSHECEEAVTAASPLHKAAHFRPNYSQRLVRQKLHLPVHALLQGGLVFKAHRWFYHSTLGSRVIKKKKKALLKVDGVRCTSALSRGGHFSLLYSRYRS